MVYLEAIWTWTDIFQAILHSMLSSPTIANQKFDHKKLFVVLSVSYLLVEVDWKKSLCFIRYAQ